MALIGAGVLDPEEGEDQGDDAEGDVEEEDPVPAEVGGDEAAYGGAYHHGGEAGPGDVEDGLGEVFLGGTAEDDEAAYGDHHGSAYALQDAGEGELGEGVAEAAEYGGEGEGSDGEGEDGACAEAVGYPAADGDADGQSEEVGGHADVEVDGADVKAARHLGESGGDDGAVQVLHEDGAGDQHGDEEWGGLVLHCSSN